MNLEPAARRNLAYKQRIRMPSRNELIELFQNGELSKLLAQRFQGQIRTYPTKEMKDSDFLVVFESEEKTPDAKKITETVTKFYADKGYEVKPDDNSDSNYFGALIFYNRNAREATCISVSITTRYFTSEKSGYASLRATCEILM